MHVGTLATEVALLDVLLSVVPGSARVGQEVGHERTDHDDRSQVAAECELAHAEPDHDRHQHRQQGRGGELTECSTGADVDDRAVVGLLGVVHDAGLLPELATDLLHHDACGAAHGEDRQSGEQEHDRAADQARGEHLRVGHVDGNRLEDIPGLLRDRLAEAGEQGDGRDHR